jgi:hypothetical protein
MRRHKEAQARPRAYLLLRGRRGASDVANILMKRREQGSANELRSTMMIMMLREDFAEQQGEKSVRGKQDIRSDGARVCFAR